MPKVSEHGQKDCIGVFLFLLRIFLCQSRRSSHLLRLE